MIRSVQNRIIFLIALIGSGMFAGIMISRSIDAQRIESMLQDEKARNAVLLERVMDSKSKSLKDFAYDYTYWDEMVNFVKKPDSAWAIDNIQVSLPTFNIQYSWVFDKNLKLLYQTSSGTGTPPIEFPLTGNELKNLISTGPHYSFYIKMQTALLQISGGSIHPSSDPERKTPPNGYLFVGRIWKDSYIDDIKNFTGTNLSILYPDKNSVPADSIIPDQFTFINFKPLNGWNGDTQALVRSSGNMKMARDYQVRAHSNMIIVVICLITALAFVSFILIRSVNRPLKSIIVSLMNEDSTAVGGLIGQKSEFGRIAQLISEFFFQKKKLLEEIEVRKKIHEELIEAKERSEESDRLKTSFLNNISHEIRTPMNAINGFSELLTEPKLSDEEKLEFSKIIYDSSNRLLEVITDLINISTIESGQMEICEEFVNLNSLLRSVLEQISYELDFKKVKIKLDVALEDEQSGIKSDPSKLCQILTHLLKNSAKFTHSGTIEFGYEIRHGDIEFFISDTGIGIPTAKFETIFARFQQVDDSTSRQFGGAGLGLPISKAYVELLGGKIWLKSKEGVGTQFYFTIPYNPA